MTPLVGVGGIWSVVGREWESFMAFNGSLKPWQRWNKCSSQFCKDIWFSDNWIIWKCLAWMWFLPASGSWQGIGNTVKLQSYKCPVKLEVSTYSWMPSSDILNYFTFIILLHLLVKGNPLHNCAGKSAGVIKLKQMLKKLSLHKI